MKRILIVAMLAISATCQAGISTCNDMYVGRIWTIQGVHGIYAAVFLDSPSDSSGSYWVYFSTYDADDRKTVLAVLMAAKLAGHRVNLETTQTNKCDIASGGTEAAAVFLSTNP